MTTPNPKFMYLPLFTQDRILESMVKEDGIYNCEPWQYHNYMDFFGDSCYLGCLILDFMGNEYNRNPEIHLSVPTKLLEHMGFEPITRLWFPVFRWDAARKNMKWPWRTGWQKDIAGFTKINDYDMIGYVGVGYLNNREITGIRWKSEPKKPFVKKEVS